MKNYRLAIWVILSLAIAALGYFWATGLMDSLYAYRSPLKDNPPAAGEPLGEPLTRRVVLVLIDALRYDTSTKTNVMPFLNQLRGQGASAVMHSRPPSFSAPGYSVLMTGAWPDLSDGPAMNPEGDELPRTWTQDNLFTAAHRAGLRTAVSGYDWFQGLIPQEVVDASYYTPGEDAAADRAVMDAALPWLEGDYQLILVHIDQVDWAGHHEGGPRDPRWDAAATRADDHLREIVSSLDLARDTVIAFSDHGQIDAGGHGGHDPITLVEPFVAAGVGIVPGEYTDIQMVDLAPTVAALLGTNVPASAQGRILTEMLSLSPGQLQQMENIQSYQQVQLANAYTEAIGRPVLLEPLETDVGSAQAAMDSAKQSRLTSERAPRFAIVLLLLAGISLLVWKNWNGNFLWMGIAALLYPLAFHIRYALLAGRTYSLSSVASAGDLIGFTAATALVILALLWLALSLWLGVFKKEPRRAAETTFQIVFAVLMVISLPALWSYAYNGAVITWTLPDMASMFLGFLSILQMLVIAALGLALAGIASLTALVVRRLKIQGRKSKVEGRMLDF